jgi:iron complex outermembrane receptor protein
MTLNPKKMLRNVLLLAAALAAAPAHAQQPGSLVGTVRTEAGAAVASARVALRPSGQVRTTDASGRFTFEAVPAGRYTLSATRIGFVAAELRVDVAPGAESGIDVTLPAAAVALEGIRIQGQRQRVASATRTETELVDIPQAIQVVGQDVIRAQAVTEMRDALRNVSGVTFTGTYSGGYEFYSSRGFSMSNVANYRRNGLLLPNFGQNYADYVERVEVLKGPSGILYGDVTPGGVLNVVTKRPQATPYRRAELRVGSHGLVRPSVDVTGPLNRSGTLLGRVNASYERAESFRDMVESEGWMVAPALTWALGARSAWHLEGSVREDSRVGDPGLISPDGTVEGLARVPRSRFLGEPDATYAYDDRTAVSTLEHHLAGGWRVRQVAAYGFQTRTPRNIYLGEVAEDGTVSRQQYFFHQERETRSASLDLLGEARTGPVRHRVLLGADWSNHRSHTGRFAEADLPGGISLFGPTYGRAEYAPIPAEMDPTVLETRRVGLYAQDQASLWGDRLHLLLGVRLNRFRDGVRAVEDGAAPEAEDVRERLLSPRFGVVAKLAGWLSTYASYSEAYEVNGLDWIDPSIAIRPTYGRQWEAGIKGDLLGRRLGFTLSAFQIRKSDVYGWADTPESGVPAFAVAADTLGGWYTYGGATHRSRGVELDVNGRVTDRLLVTAAAARTDARIVDDPAYAAGNLLRNTPRETFNVWANYQLAGPLAGADVGGGFFYKGRFYGSDDNAPGGLVPANHTVDLSAGYQWGTRRLQLNVRNLTDRTSYLGGFGSWEPLPPRALVLTASTRF